MAGSGGGDRTVARGGVKSGTTPRRRGCSTRSLRMNASPIRVHFAVEEVGVLHLTLCHTSLSGATLAKHSSVVAASLGVWHHGRTEVARGGVLPVSDVDTEPRRRGEEARIGVISSSALRRADRGVLPCICLLQIASRAHFSSDLAHLKPGRTGDNLRCRDLTRLREGVCSVRREARPSQRLHHAAASSRSADDGAYYSQKYYY